jgi:SnoaL-like polyketide cyclase
MRITINTEELAHLVVDEIWNGGKLEVADTLFGEGYVNHGGLIPDLLRGPEAIKLSVALFRSAFPDFHVTVDDVAIDKDATVVRWVAHSRPPRVDGRTNNKSGLRGITRFRIESGQIAESWTVWDSRTALVRLGAVTAG